MNQRNNKSQSHTISSSGKKNAKQCQQTVSLQEQELQHLRNELRSLQQFYDTVLENANIGVFRCSVAGEILLLNQTIAAMLGYDNPEQVRQNLHHIIDHKYFSRQRLSDLIEIIRKNRPITTFNLGLTKKDGKILVASVKMKTVLDDHGNPIYIDGMVEDISYQKEIETQIEQSQKKLDSADLAKSQFLANMSHEIRTPVNGIIGAALLLLDSQLSPEHRELLEILNESAKSLAILVNDILDFSKIEAGKFEILNINFDLWETLLKIKRAFILEARRKEISLILRILPGVPRMINGDPNRLGQVLKNLVSNAIKFTDEGEVKIKVSVISKKKENAKLFISVSDTGIGIWKENIPKLFKAFAQIEGSYTKKIQGTGLGLVISKKMINLMQGEIWVKSKKGEGSVFCIRIPLRPAAPESWQNLLPNRTDDSPDTSLSPKRILIADDNLLSRKVCAQMLRNAGNKVTAVANGLEVIARLEKEKFDLILMDIQMPEMDGIETTRQIRIASPERFNPHIPIIALTAYTLAHDLEKMRKIGVSDYLSKPIDWKELFLKINQTAAKKKQNPIFTPTAALDNQNYVIEIDNLTRRFSDQTAFLQELFNNFVQEAPAIMAQLTKAVQKQDYNLIEISSHSMVNITGFLQLTTGVNIARNIEAAVRAANLETMIENNQQLEHYIANVISYIKQNQ